MYDFFVALFYVCLIVNMTLIKRLTSMNMKENLFRVPYRLLDIKAQCQDLALVVQKLE